MFTDYMSDRTYRAMEESRRQMMGQMVPDTKIRQPTIDVSKMLAPSSVFDGLLEQVNRHSTSLAETALLGNNRMQSAISERIAAAGTSAMDAYFGRGLGVFAQAQTALALTYTAPTISEMLYGSKGFRSVFDTIGPSMSQMAAVLIDTKTRSGFGNTQGVVSQLAEQWRLSNTGELSGLGSIASIRDSFNLGGVTASSAMARTLLGSASALDAARVAALSQIELAPEYAAIVDEILSEDEDAASVAVAMERRLIDRFKISRASAHSVVRVIIWIASAAIMIGVTQGIPILGQVLSVFNDSLDLFSPREFSKKAAKKLIPLPENEEPRDEEK